MQTFNLARDFEMFTNIRHLVKGRVVHGFTFGNSPAFSSCLLGVQEYWVHYM